ncbi:16S rRNA (cytosine(967)-C(5))-methyltransferase RsmB [Oscillospiraceae bacterium PP1C4]
MKDARYTAVQALLRLTTANAYSNLVVDSLIKQNQLDARDSAFASALFYGTLERMLTIDHILKKYSSKPLDKLSPPVLQTLRCGVYQLVYMDGVDDYAAVSESVNLVKALGKEKASGFVNGILRSFLRDNKAIPPVKGSRADTLAVAYSCPAWLISVWLEAYGEEASMRMLEGSLGKPPIYLRVNTLRVTTDRLLQMLADQGVECEADDQTEHCIVVKGRIAVEHLDAFKDGLFHVQDKASQLCAAALSAQPGERVLDVCAAPGGKTFTIAQSMQDKGELIARDLHEKRTSLVRSGARRLDIGIVKASAGDAGVYDKTLGEFDRILCDVPCSGFGIIRRKPEIKYKTQDSVQNLPEIQYKILQTSSQYLKSGGTMVYSTCTLLPRENEQVVERFLGANQNFMLVSQQTYTGEQIDTDGFFVSVLKKR